MGTGWNFDGIDLYVNSTNVSSADSSFTISAWFANIDSTDKGMTAFQAFEGIWDISFHRTESQLNAGLDKLRGAGVLIESVEPVRNSLEEVFLRAIGGDETPDEAATEAPAA